jgi:hypothetical protein
MLIYKSYLKRADKYWKNQATGFRVSGVVFNYYYEYAVFWRHITMCRKYHMDSMLEFYNWESDVNT